MIKPFESVGNNGQARAVNEHQISEIKVKFVASRIAISIYYLTSKGGYGTKGKLGWQENGALHSSPLPLHGDPYNSDLLPDP